MHYRSVHNHFPTHFALSDLNLVGCAWKHAGAFTYMVAAFFCRNMLVLLSINLLHYVKSKANVQFCSRNSSNQTILREMQQIITFRIVSAVIMLFVCSETSLSLINITNSNEIFCSSSLRWSFMHFSYKNCRTSAPVLLMHIWTRTHMMCGMTQEVVMKQQRQRKQKCVWHSTDRQTDALNSLNNCNL